MRRHRRIVATVLALVGLVGAAASLDVTSAAWTDEAHFSANVSSGQWGTTTTTLPPQLPGDPDGGISPGNPDTVISGIDWSLNGSKQFCTEVSITGKTSTPKPWQIDVDLTQAPFYGVSPSGVQTNSTGVITVVNPQTLKITGNGPHGWPWHPQQNNTPITNTQTARLTICVYNAPVPPPAHPSTYTVTYANGTWTNTQACVVATITTTRNDLAQFPFHYGWSIPLDLTAAKAMITSVGNTLNYVGWSPYPNGPTDGTATPSTYSPPADSYTFTSGFNNTLRAAGGGADSRTVTACVFGYSTGGNGNGNGNARIASTPEVELATEGKSAPPLAGIPESGVATSTSTTTTSTTSTTTASTTTTSTTTASTTSGTPTPTATIETTTSTPPAVEPSSTLPPATAPETTAPSTVTPTVAPPSTAPNG